MCVRCVRCSVGGCGVCLVCVAIECLRGREQHVPKPFDHSRYLIRLFSSSCLTGNSGETSFVDPRRDRARFSSITSPSAIFKTSDRVSRTKSSQCAQIWLELTAQLSDSARTCHRVLETQCCNMLAHRCLVEVFRSEVAWVLRALLSASAKSLSQ